MVSGNLSPDGQCQKFVVTLDFLCLGSVDSSFGIAEHPRVIRLFRGYVVYLLVMQLKDRLHLEKIISHVHSLHPTSGGRI